MARVAPGGVRRLTRLGLLVAVGLMLSLLERQLPPPAPVPGVRWGLANAATLVALALEGPGGAFIVWALRFLLVSLFSGSFFAPAFFVGGTGGVLAWAAMVGLSRRGMLSVAGLSMTGAVAHHLGQVAAAAVVTATPGVILLLPPLLLLAVPVGLLTGFLVDLLLRRLRLAGVPMPAAARGWLGGPRSIRRIDLAMAGALCAAAVLLMAPRWWSPLTGQSSATAEVTVAGEKVLRVDLSRDGLYPIAAQGGALVAEVAEGAVRVREADCPDQVCVLTGWVRRPGDLVVCAPLRVVVRVTGGRDSGPDVILR